MKKRSFLGIALLSVLALMGASCRYQPPVVPDEEKQPAVETKTPPRKEAPPANVKEEEEKNNDEDREEKETDNAQDGMGRAGEEEKQDTVREEDHEQNEEESKTGVKRLQDFEAEVDEDSIAFFLVGKAGEYEGKDAVFSLSCDALLVPVTVELEKSQSDLATAIVQLLVTKKAAYQDEGLVNSVISHGITLENVHYEEGVRIIDFVGEPAFADNCEAEQVKAQIEETIKLYSDNFEIRMNGSKEGWEQLFVQA